MRAFTPADRLCGIKRREVETLTWVARGKTSAEIAQILVLLRFS
jgi:hypothetical protein